MEKLCSIAPYIEHFPCFSEDCFVVTNAPRNDFNIYFAKFISLSGLYGLGVW